MKQNLIDYGYGVGALVAHRGMNDLRIIRSTSYQLGETMVGAEYIISRLSAGMEGLDELMGGGLPENSQNLVVGDPGSGKTLFSIEAAYKSALSGIKTTLITTDQSVNDVLKCTNSVFPNFNLKKVIDSGFLNLVEIEMEAEFGNRENFLMFLANIINASRANESKFLVLDSISLMRSLFDTNRTFTRSVNYMMESLRNSKLTSIVTLESSQHYHNTAPGLYEQSMFDGVLKLKNFKNNGQIKHFIYVDKLRYSKFSPEYFGFDITSNGLVINEDKIIQNSVLY
ncbi:MAG: hypothetical protein M1122_03330 [Candidatus Marsarchaeota archaeon]|jgi:KaiC/GvpD/RAD55 family RecA-like ATPase|nr:hypothetical protein [Candidatus Marsarchaeota archaeon]